MLKKKLLLILFGFLISILLVELIEKISSDLKLIYYDLLDDLKKTENINKLYLDDLNDHFSPKGNELVANLIANFLKEKKLVPNN